MSWVVRDEIGVGQEGNQAAGRASAKVPWQKNSQWIPELT